MSHCYYSQFIFNIFQAKFIVYSTLTQGVFLKGSSRAVVDKGLFKIHRNKVALAAYYKNYN